MGQIMKMVEDTRRQVYQNTQLLTQILQSSSQMAVEETGDSFDLPVGSVEEMDKLDVWLSTRANYTTLVSIVLYNKNFHHFFS